MRALGVVAVHEAIEAGLLIGKGLAALGLFVQRAVHAFMPAVLRRSSRLNAFGSDAELDPPHAQGTEAAGCSTGKRRSIITAYHVR